MQLVTGVDLIDIERFEAAVERHGSRLLERIFTPSELDVCNGRVESLAARFAAKEAVAKALGVGMGTVGWREIEVTRDSLQAPFLVLSGEARRLANVKGLTNWSLSLSHEKRYAIAFVVAMDG